MLTGCSIDRTCGVGSRIDRMGIWRFTFSKGISLEHLSHLTLVWRFLPVKARQCIPGSKSPISFHPTFIFFIIVASTECWDAKVALGSCSLGLEEAVAETFYITRFRFVGCHQFRDPVLVFFSRMYNRTNLVSDITAVFFLSQVYI